MNFEHIKYVCYARITIYKEQKNKKKKRKKRKNTKN